MFEEVDFHRAAINWIEWSADYECPPGNILPVLAHDDRFVRFCHEYSVPNKCSPDRYNLGDIRQFILENIAEMLNPMALAGAMVDNNICTQHQISLASKIATFRAPHEYTPIDRFVKLGISGLDNQGNNFEYNNFIARFNAIMVQNEEMYNDIFNGNPLPTNNVAAFQRRVFDCALMRLGGRWPMPPAPPQAQ